MQAQYDIIRDAIRVILESSSIPPGPRDVVTGLEGAEESVQAQSLMKALNGFSNEDWGRLTHQERHILQLAGIAARHYRGA